jgi:hypothetical protein
MLPKKQTDNQAKHDTCQCQDHPETQFLQVIAQTHAWQFFLFIVVFSHIVFLMLSVSGQFTEIDAAWQLLFDGTEIGETLYCSYELETCLDFGCRNLLLYQQCGVCIRQDHPAAQAGR